MSDRDRGFTGLVLFAGLMLLGIGTGLGFGRAEIGAIVGLGSWFTTLGLLRVWRAH